jgi:hypothetical protein
LRVTSYEELNAWLLDRCVAYAKGDCQEFRAGLGMIGAKEPDDATPQRTSYS